MSTLPPTLGALEVAVLISSVLYGVTTLQAWLYAEQYSADPWYLRIMAGTIWVFETFHTLFIWIYIYWLTITNYGQPAALLSTNWSFLASVPLTFLVALMVHLFYAYRVRVVGGRGVIPLISGIGAILHFISGISEAVLVSTTHPLPLFFSKWRWLLTTQGILSMCIDLLNTSSLCFYLVRRRTDVKSTRRAVDRIMMYAIETGLITSLCAVFIVIAYFAWPNDYIDFALFLIYPKLFSNSFFAVLNVRGSLRTELRSHEPSMMSTRIYAPPQSENSVVTMQLDDGRGQVPDGLIRLPTFVRPVSSEKGLTEIVSV